ncbi:hypothetical protein HNV12_04340 [Methanococcoides sp. SA1]|nr:hypothetical protein [Methanococcoides sp. SA1]
MGILYISREGKRVNGFSKIVGNAIDKIPGISVVYSQTAGIYDQKDGVRFSYVSKRRRPELDLELRVYEQEHR